MFKKLLVALLCSVGVMTASAQQHTIPTLDRNNAWTGTNSYAQGTQLATAQAQPACTVATRGTLWNVEGAPDMFSVCEQSATAGTYNWVTFINPLGLNNVWTGTNKFNNTSTFAGEADFTGNTTFATDSNTFNGQMTNNDYTNFNQGVGVTTSTTQPTCAVGLRGTIWVVQGTPDVVQICADTSTTSTPTYAWTSLGSGGGSSGCGTGGCVTSINASPGAFSFTGNGVHCVGTACSFTAGGSDSGPVFGTIVYADNFPGTFGQSGTSGVANNYKGTYSNTTNYVQGDSVVYQGINYVAVAPSGPTTTVATPLAQNIATTGFPASEAYWVEELGTPTGFIATQWDVAKAYARGLADINGNGVQLLMSGNIYTKCGDGDLGNQTQSGVVNLSGWAQFSTAVDQSCPSIQNATYKAVSTNGTSVTTTTINDWQPGDEIDDSTGIFAAHTYVTAVSISGTYPSQTWTLTLSNNYTATSGATITGQYGYPLFRHLGYQAGGTYFSMRHLEGATIANSKGGTWGWMEMDGLERSEFTDLLMRDQSVGNHYSILWGNQYDPNGQVIEMHRLNNILLNQSFVGNGQDSFSLIRPIVDPVSRKLTAAYLWGLASKAVTGYTITGGNSITVTTTGTTSSTWTVGNTVVLSDDDTSLCLNGASIVISASTSTSFTGPYSGTCPNGAQTEAAYATTSQTGYYHPGWNGTAIPAGTPSLSMHLQGNYPGNGGTFGPATLTSGSAVISLNGGTGIAQPFYPGEGLSGSGIAGATFVSSSTTSGGLTTSITMTKNATASGTITANYILAAIGDQPCFQMPTGYGATATQIGTSGTYTTGSVTVGTGSGECGVPLTAVTTAGSSVIQVASTVGLHTGQGVQDGAAVTDPLWAAIPPQCFISAIDQTTNKVTLQNFYNTSDTGQCNAGTTLQNAKLLVTDIGGTIDYTCAQDYVEQNDIISDSTIVDYRIAGCAANAAMRNSLHGGNTYVHLHIFNQNGLNIRDGIEDNHGGWFLYDYSCDTLQRHCLNLTLGNDTIDGISQFWNTAGGVSDPNFSQVFLGPTSQITLNHTQCALMALWGGYHQFTSPTGVIDPGGSIRIHETNNQVCEGLSGTQLLATYESAYTGNFSIGPVADAKSTGGTVQPSGNLGLCAAQWYSPISASYNNCVQLQHFVNSTVDEFRVTFTQQNQLSTIFGANFINASQPTAAETAAVAPNINLRGNLLHASGTAQTATSLSCAADGVTVTASGTFTGFSSGEIVEIGGTATNFLGPMTLLTASGSTLTGTSLSCSGSGVTGGTIQGSVVANDNMTFQPYVGDGIDPVVALDMLPILSGGTSSVSYLGIQGFVDDASSALMNGTYPDQQDLHTAYTKFTVGQSGTSADWSSPHGSSLSSIAITYAGTGLTNGTYNIPANAGACPAASNPMAHVIVSGGIVTSATINHATNPASPGWGCTGQVVFDPTAVGMVGASAAAPVLTPAFNTGAVMSVHADGTNHAFDMRSNYFATYSNQPAITLGSAAYALTYNGGAILNSVSALSYVTQNIGNSTTITNVVPSPSGVTGSVFGQGIPTSSTVTSTTTNTVTMNNNPTILGPIVFSINNVFYTGFVSNGPAYYLQQAATVNTPQLISRPNAPTDGVATLQITNNGTGPALIANNSSTGMSIQAGGVTGIGFDYAGDVISPMFLSPTKNGTGYYDTITSGVSGTAMIIDRPANDAVATLQINGEGSSGLAVRCNGAANSNTSFHTGTISAVDCTGNMLAPSYSSNENVVSTSTFIGNPNAMVNYVAMAGVSGNFSLAQPTTDGIHADTCTTVIVVQNGTTARTLGVSGSTVAIHGWFSGNSGAIGTTLSGFNSTHLCYSSTANGWIADSPGIVNQ